MTDATGTGDKGTVAEAPLCPYYEGRPFDPLDVTQVADPSPWLERARHEAPVFYMPNYDMWCVTRYDDVVRVLRDVATFTSENAFGGEIRIHPDVKNDLPSHPEQRALIAFDPPEHTPLRKLSNRVFTPKLIAAQEERIRTIANELIDEFIDDGRVDLCARYSGLLSSRVMMDFIGAPREMTEQVMNWTHDCVRMMAISEELPDRELLAHSLRALDWDRWLRALIDERRTSPTEDLISLLVNATDDDGQSTVADVQDLCGLISGTIAAGVETTTTFISMLVYLLLTHPDQWAEVKADTALIPRAVEEGLRLSTPLRGIYRTAKVESVVGGVTIPANATVYLHYGSSDRDGEVFEDGDSFDIHRANLSKHLAFGHGVHFCLGAPLARLESRVALVCLIERIPDLRLAEPLGEWNVNMQVPAPKSVIVEWPVPASEWALARADG